MARIFKNALCLAPLPEGGVATNHLPPRERSCQRLKNHKSCHQTRSRAWFEGEKESWSRFPRGHTEWA